MALGFASGAIEWATEKYSIEALMNIKPGDKIWKSIAKNFVTEGSEEGASTIANFFVNMALAGEKSDYQQAIQNYIEYGYTESEAKKKAYLDLGKQVVSDVAAGALMGGVLGAGTAISSNIAKKNVLSGEYAKAYGQAALISDNAQAIIDNAKEFGIDTQNAEKALAELDIIEEEFDKNPTSKELHDQWQEQFEKTADTLSELELYIEQSGGQTELDITEQEFQSENYNSPLESRETGINEFDEEVERQADIAEASDIIENDLHDRGVTNQDRIVNNFKAKTIANEVSKLHDGKIKVDGDIRTDKISRRVQAFYDSKGLETVWFKNSYVKDKNGNFTKAQINGFTNGNKIYLNSDVPIERQIFKHEYHHTLENAKGFENYSKRLENSKAFKEWILNKAKKLNATGTYNNQYRAVLNNYISMYGVATKLSNTQAKNEAFADFMAEELFSGKNFNDTMNKLEEAFEDKNGFQKFIDTIKDIVSKIKEALGGSASIEALERNIIKLQKQIDSGKTGQNKNTDSNNGVKYEINPDFENDIKTWDRNGKSDEESFILGSTGDVLQGLGARENDIYINGSKINTILREHPEMSLDVIKKIPEILENPILVLSSKNKVNNNTRMVMFGRINAENGKPVLCVLDLIPKENKIILDDMQKAVSAYSKTNSAEDIKSFFERSEVLYTSKNKKITTNLLTRVGFSMPTDLLKSGYIGSITYGNENVNIKGKPFNEVFSYDTNNSISENAENDTDIQQMYTGEKSQTADKLKLETAGEIEATDVQNRLNLNNEQRKNTRPDIDKTDVVFSDRNDVSYSLNVDNEIIDRYTEKQYNNFGWVRANNVLTSAEYQHFTHEFANYKKLNNKPFGYNSITGESIIRTGNDLNTLNVFVYVRGDIDNPEITKIVRFNTTDKTELNIIKEGYLYADSRETENSYENVQKVFGNEFATVINRQDLQSFYEYQRGKQRSVSTENSGHSQFDKGRKNNRTENNETEAGLDKSAFSIGDDLEALNEKYGTIKKGANAERDIDVPKKTSDNMVTSLTVRSILEKGNIDGETLERIKTDVINEARSHKSYSDKQALDYAKRHLENGDAEIMWNEAIKGKVTKNDIALGEALIEMYANSTELSDTEKADKILNLTAELCEVGTRLGQAVQAFSLLKKMGGVGRLYYLQKTVNTLNKDLEKKYKGKKQVKIGEAEAEFLANAKNEQEVTEAAQEIMKSVGEQVPSTFLDKWNAWRYLSMLGNPRTHIRNLVGNAVFVPAVEIKNAFGTAMEHIFIRDTSKRTKAIKISKGTVSFANKDFKLMSDYISSGGKYNDNTEIEDAKQIFKFKPLEAFRKLNFKALEAEDMVFLKYHYVRAMSQALTAKKIDVNNISESQLQQVREYAVNEAWKATYRDASAVANAINRFSKVKGVGLVIEGILPFKKTPINILKRGIEYSPIGLIKTIGKAAVDIKNGEYSGAEFIDGISSGLTGTGIMALGMLLSSMGIAIGGFGGDDDEWFRQLNGEQEYAIVIGDKSYTVDWAAPACIPFFIGVELYQSLQQDYSNNWTKFINTIGDSAFEPIVNLSMMQGINDTLNTIKWDDNPIESVLYNAFQSYFLQALPTLAGQVTRIAVPERQINYIDENSAIPKFMQKTLNKISSKTGYWRQNDYVDAWGNYDITKGIANRIVQNMLSPGYVSTVNYDSVNNEIARLYNAKGNKLVLPDSVDTEIKIDGETKYLTADEYEKYQTQAGQNAYKYIDELIKTSTYKYADDDTKIEMITDIYSYAENKAKTTVSDYKLSDSEAKLDMYLQRNVSLDEYFDEKYKNEQDEDEKITLDNEKVNEILDDVENSPTYQNASSKKKMSMVDAVVKYVKDSQKNNLSKSDEIIKEVEDSGNNISGLIINKGAVSGKTSKKDKLNAIKKSGADSESKYISMAYEYLTGRKVTYNGKYLYFSDLTAAQKYKYISSNKSSIKAGLYEDYGV
ncbi:MAG: hypothetical protein ACI39F_08965 [Acutalibacteraceae bacterium]